MKIIADTIAEAHEACCDAIIESHRDINIMTSKEEFTLEFIPSGREDDDFLVIQILHPEQEPQISEGASFHAGLAEAYKKQFLTLSLPRADGMEAVYTYFNRFKDYPVMKPVDVCTGPNEESRTEYRVAGNGRGDGYDQVSRTIEKLARDPNNRRGVMITWYPPLDTESREPPCLNWVQFVIRDGKLHMRVVIRSNDMLSAAGENFIGDAAFFRYVLDGINTFRRNLALQAGRTEWNCIAMGTLTVVSTIPHIYVKRDHSEFEKMRRYILNKKAARAWKVRVRD